MSLPTVAIVGASQKKHRYSFLAQELLTEKGYPVILISPKSETIMGKPTIPSLSHTHEAIDTVTLYVSAPLQSNIIQDILTIKPRRVIFNPGTENPKAYALLDEAGIECEEACTLVLLRTKQF